MHLLLPPILSILGPGLAVDATEMAPAMRGDIEVRYTFGQERTRLMEGTTEVGQRTISVHHMDTTLSFNPVPGAGLFIQLPASPGTHISYGSAFQMGFDPGNDSGSMLAMQEIKSPEQIDGKGLEGTWIGVRGSPLHEDLYSSRGDRASWVMDVGYRFKDKTNLYSIGDEGLRGSGPGASAWLIRGAFSTTYNQTQPYVVATWIASGLLTADIVDDSGDILTKNADIRPASTVTIRTGAAGLAHTWGVGKNAGQVLVDPHLEFGFQSWQDVPSGTFLPDVLDASRSLLATESEFAFLSTGVNLDIRIMEYIELDIGADVGIRSGHQVEHLYPIDTSMGTLTWQTSAALRFRARDPLLDGVLPSSPAPF